MSVFAFRLAALYVWIRTILEVSYLPMMISMSDENLGRASWVGYAISIGLHALLGTALWFASPLLARRVLGGPADGVSRASAIGELALRLAGVWLIDLALKGVWSVAFQLEYSSARGSPSTLWNAIANSAAHAILGVVLLVAGGRLAARMFPSSAPQKSLASELQAVAFSILGLVLVVRALPAVLSGFTTSGEWFDDGDVVTLAEPVPWPAIVASLVRLTLGIALFVGGGLLSRAWRWARSAGLGGDRTSSDVRRS